MDPTIAILGGVVLILLIIVVVLAVSRGDRTIA